ncbi:hypothetical protein NDU88_000542 [Pleurodeles waltl]|uniref:Uncharacterized protein n=1 Tax=Pleurodeles waltl TaxID=8319 RepID=A0AAV7L6T9_PLEWA|nr:hypothetical protein NDU88_000542 [Pleurodeles waltl]
MRGGRAAATGLREPPCWLGAEAGGVTRPRWAQTREGGERPGGSARGPGRAAVGQRADRPPLSAMEPAPLARHAHILIIR